MVRALLEGRKTQTRRVLKLPAVKGRGAWEASTVGGPRLPARYGKPYPETPCVWHTRTGWGVAPGEAPCDLLWVREGFAEVGHVDPPHRLYRASGYEAECLRHGFDKPYPPESVVKWKPSIFMPRWASRLTLRVTEVRVQRLQEISEEDAQAEGAGFDSEPCDHARRTCAEIGCAGPGYRGGFAELWQSLNAERGFGWDVNPWVIAVSFDVIAGNIEAVKARA
jgi:hypothetical protein